MAGQRRRLGQRCATLDQVKTVLSAATVVAVAIVEDSETTCTFTYRRLPDGAEAANDLLITALASAPTEI